LTHCAVHAAACRRNEKARSFLMLLRQSQLFEVFVRERLEMYATVEGGPELSGKPGLLGYIGGCTSDAPVRHSWYHGHALLSGMM
jgi:hypothetical protein